MVIATVTHAAAKAIATHLANELGRHNNHEKLLNFMAKLKALRNLLNRNFTVPINNAEEINTLDH